jgi:hypothetical protein
MQRNFLMQNKPKGGSIDAARAAASSEGEYCNTVAGWCQEATISLGTYFNLRRQGRGPYIGKAGRRTPVIESPPAYFRLMAGKP